MSRPSGVSSGGSLQALNAQTKAARTQREDPWRRGTPAVYRDTTALRASRRGDPRGMHEELMQRSVGTPEPRIPHLSLGAVFLQFLRFGSLAWGGPVAQIAMLQRELGRSARARRAAV